MGMIVPRSTPENTCYVTSSIAERLKRAMEQAGLTQTALEAQARLSKGYLSRVLSGERKSIGGEKLAKIAAACGVRAEWLVTGEGERAAAASTRPAPAP